MLSALLSIAVATAGLDSAPPPPSGSDVVVTGQRVADEQTEAFVRALMPRSKWSQAGRFHSAICPAVFGLPAVQKANIVQRMRVVAGAAGISVASERCRANLNIIVTSSKPKVLASVARLAPHYLEGVPPRVGRAMVRDSSPATVLHAKGLLNADGLELPRGPLQGPYINSTSSNPSRISAPSKPHFAASLMVLDLAALGGLTVTQIADYALLRTLADVDPTRVAKVGAPTLLTMLDQPADRPVPITLTAWDFAYLQALYRTNNALYAGYQRGDMTAIVKKELEKGAGGRR